MSLFKQRKNRRFKYTPRHLREHESQLKEELESKRRQTKHVSKHRGTATSTLLVLLVILGMIIAFWYILDNYNN